jgi:gluconate 5-dehydrogenase
MASTVDLFRLDGRIALVTGSSQGLGLAMACGLAGAGATVVINGRSAEKVDAAVAALTAEGLKARGAAFDVTAAGPVDAAVAAIERDIGPIDILFNNAGIQRRRPLDEFTDEDWRDVMATNVDSVFYLSRAVARRMIPRKRGAIVNTCSVMSELGRPTIVPYTASKGAVKLMTRGMAAEWGKHGIRVNGIGPGYFATEMNTALMNDEKFSSWVAARTPLGRWGKVEELVGAAVYLASDAASFVTGHVIYVDGGMTAVV